MEPLENRVLPESRRWVSEVFGRFRAPAVESPGGGCHDALDRLHEVPDRLDGKPTSDHAMSETRMTYFDEEDLLHLTISAELEANSVELSPNITAELHDAGELIGIEILNASKYLRDSILHSAQARMLSLPRAETA